MPPLTLATLAAQLAIALHARTRDNGDTFIRLADGSPEWMRDVIRVAHADYGTMLPDDYRYSLIQSLADELADTDDADTVDDLRDRLDAHVYIYTVDLTRWLASAVIRVDYVDAVLKEYGPAADCFSLLQQAQLHEIESTFDQLVTALEEELARQLADAEAE